MSWSVDTSNPYRIVIHAPDSTVIEVWGKNRKAVARLLKSAPDMLEALKFVRDELEKGGIDSERLLFLARATIAEAGGK